jgi:N-acetylmuramoyl-L-alanine amidase
MKACVNAGHYPGLDSGAVNNQTGLQEADVAKDIMQKTAYYLRPVGYEVLEVQENELYQITDASNNFNSDVFISIHCNAAKNTNAKGTETFCYKFGGKSEQLARCIQNQIVNSLGTVDRGIKEGNFAVIRYTNCPAVLIETAFISNFEDECLLADESKRDELAKAIARGVTDYAR